MEQPLRFTLGKESGTICGGSGGGKSLSFTTAATGGTGAWCPLSKPNRKSGFVPVSGGGGEEGWICTEFKASTNHCRSDLVSPEPKPVAGAEFAGKRNKRILAGLLEARNKRSYSIIMCSRSSSFVTEIRASRSSPGNWYLEQKQISTVRLKAQIYNHNLMVQALIIRYYTSRSSST